jgi:hypothetical protein
MERLRWAVAPAHAQAAPIARVRTRFTVAKGSLVVSNRAFDRDWMLPWLTSEQVADDIRSANSAMPSDVTAPLQPLQFVGEGARSLADERRITSADPASSGFGLGFRAGSQGR